MRLCLKNLDEAPPRVQMRLAPLLRDGEAILAETDQNVVINVRPMSGVEPGIETVIEEGRAAVKDSALAKFCVRICAGLRVPPKTLSRPALYLFTAGGYSITQRIHGPFDVQGRVASQGLAYRERETDASSTDRVDHVRSLGGGVGCHLGVDARIAFNVDRQTRASVESASEYEGLRYGISLTHGR